MTHGPNFEALVREHQGFIRAWLRRLTRGDQHLADDLAQETFLRALRTGASFRGDSRPRTWLARIALNVWHDHLRRHTDQHDTHIPTLEWPANDSDIDHGSGIDLANEATALSDRVANRLDIDRALERLPEGERLVVLHACWGDLSQAEISRVTGMPLGTVKTLHRRAMKRLQGWLGQTT